MLRRPTGAGAGTYRWVNNLGGNVVTLTGSLTEAWGRYEGAYSAGFLSTTTVTMVDCSDGVARDYIVDLVQNPYNPGDVSKSFYWPSEFRQSPVQIAGFAGYGRRNGDRPSHPSGLSTLVHNGRLRIEFDLTTKAATSTSPMELVHDAYLYEFGTNSYLRYAVATSRFEVYLGGTLVLATGTLTWARRDRLRLFVTVGNGTTTLKVLVNEGVVNTTTDATTRAAISGTGSIFLMHSDANMSQSSTEGATEKCGQFPCWWRFAKKWRPGEAPAWTL